jgi:hypothetical protein
MLADPFKQTGGRGWTASCRISTKNSPTATNLETTPVVMVFVRERGDPIAITNSPGRMVDELPS